MLLPQAVTCQQSYNSSVGCAAKSYCVWEFDSFDGRNVCMHRDTASRGPDAYSKEFAAVKVRRLTHVVYMCAHKGMGWCRRCGRGLQGDAAILSATHSVLSATHSGHCTLCVLHLPFRLASPCGRYRPTTHTPGTSDQHSCSKWFAVGALHRMLTIALVCGLLVLVLAGCMCQIEGTDSL